MSRFFTKQKDPVSGMDIIAPSHSFDNGLRDATLAFLEKIVGYMESDDHFRDEIDIVAKDIIKLMDGGTSYYLTIVEELFQSNKDFSAKAKKKKLDKFKKLSFTKEIHKSEAQILKHTANFILNQGDEILYSVETKLL